MIIIIAICVVLVFSPEIIKLIRKAHFKYMDRK